MGWIRGTTPTLRCRIRAAVDPGEDGDVYVSDIDYNVYEPGVYGWSVVT